MPFTLRNRKEHLEDVGSGFDGAPDLEFRLATEALELEQSGLSYQRVPPGYRFPYGHTHKKQEEVYVVLRGSGRMKVDDEIVELKELDAVRVPPGTWRGYEAGLEGLEILVIGAPNLGGARRKRVRHGPGAIGNGAPGCARGGANQTDTRGSRSLRALSTVPAARRAIPAAAPKPTPASSQSKPLDAAMTVCGGGVGSGPVGIPSWDRPRSPATNTWVVAAGVVLA